MWPTPQVTADLATFTEEIVNGKLHFLCSTYCPFQHVIYCLFKNQRQISTQGSNIFCCSKIHYKFCQGQYGLTHIWSSILQKFLSKLGYFLVFKRLFKNFIWYIMVWPIFPLQRSFSRFQPKAHIFLEFKNLFKKLYQGQYGLTYIVLSRILSKFLYNWNIFTQARKCSHNAHISIVVKNLMKNFIRDSLVWL